MMGRQKSADITARTRERKLSVARCVESDRKMIPIDGLATVLKIGISNELTYSLSSVKFWLYCSVRSTSR